MLWMRQLQLMITWFMVIVLFAFYGLYTLSFLQTYKRVQTQMFIKNEWVKKLRCVLNLFAFRISCIPLVRLRFLV